LNLNEFAESGAFIFIDADIFLHHFLGRSEDCTRFLERCAAGEIKGATGALVLAEVLHKSMILEAKAKKVSGKTGNEGARTVAKLRETPEAVRKLSDYHSGASSIMDMGLTVFPLTAKIIRASQWVRSQNGLMAGDSLVVATMRAHGISALATAGRAFEQVDTIRVYGPADGAR
jgi:predicted nucleic acid-binding protein